MLNFFFEGLKDKCIFKALRGMQDFQKALDVIEVAENLPNVNMKIVETNRRQIIAEMKGHMRK